jgi:hypothetical protein
MSWKFRLAPWRVARILSARRDGRACSWCAKAAASRITRPGHLTAQIVLAVVAIGVVAVLGFTWLFGKR